MEELSHSRLLNYLPNEVLLHVFLFCDFQSIGRLASTCRRFRNLIKDQESLWFYKSKFVLGSNMTHPDMIKRCKPFWSHFRRCQLGNNWKNGIAEMSIALTFKKCLPWMQLEKEYLYFSKGKVIQRVNRSNKDGRLCIFSKKNFPQSKIDISKFVMTEREAIFGLTNGFIGCMGKRDMKCIHVYEAHRDEIYSIDAKRDIIVTGSRDTSIMIWKTGYPLGASDHFNGLKLQKRIPMDVRVLSTAIMPSNSCFIAGTSGTKDVHPLQQFDLETGKHITNFSEYFRHGAGILCVYPEDENTFLCCGYDTTIQLWDCRCPNACVKRWVDPYDNGVYCVCSDYNVTIASGASRNGTILIWDKRNSDFECIFQVREYDSSVYNICFDASHLFAILDRGIAQFSYVNGLFEEL